MASDGRVVRPFDPHADQFEEPAIDDVDRAMGPAIVADRDGHVRIGIGVGFQPPGGLPPCAPDGVDPDI